MDLELARKCRELRINKKLSYRQFADRCGLKIETIKEYEKGVLSIPTKVLQEYEKLVDTSENNN